MSKSPTTIDEVWSGDPADWLPNQHAGDILASEFMQPLGLTTSDLGASLGVASRDLDAVIAGVARMTGDLDLRLARYFRMSEGFFLRLEGRYELLEAKRALNGALDRIIPRAA